MHPSIKPFRVDVPEATLVDLQARLQSARLPAYEPVGEPWRYGTALDYMHGVLRYWRDEYDWRAWEKRLNRFKHFRTSLGSGDVHFIVEEGSGTAPTPLLLTHGWPGSFVEFLDIIEPLAHPERFGGRVEDAFTVVVPSLPGYGFSDPPPAPITPRDVAALWRTLMVEKLGFDRYVAQGGDWGATVTSWLALDHPAELAAIHLNMVSFRPWTGAGAAPLDDDEKRWLEAAQKRRDGETAYQQIQGTKPQTLAYALTDSPVGLAAWILEKFHGWTIPKQNAAPPFDPGHLLTNIMLYWINGINAANWLYCATVNGTSSFLQPGEKVAVPTGVLLFPDDLSVPPPNAWIKRVYYLVHRSDALTGGHFGALQCGAAFVADVRLFFRAYR
ncbi:MAG: epoxide hydrolase family protein [Janthinobacterium lividum]